MMFATLTGFLEKNNATLMLTAEGERITVTVVPKPKGESEASLRTPLMITGTAAELDEGFAEVLAQYVSAHKSLADQLVETKTLLERAKNESAAKAVKASPKSSATQAVQIDDLTGDDENDDGADVGATAEPVTAAVKPEEKSKATPSLDLASLL